MRTIKFLLVLVCLLLLGCRNERASGDPTSTPIPEDPQVVNLNPNVIVEKWEYLSPRSEEALTSFPSSDPAAIKFGSELDETYIVWRKGGFDLIWGNVICSTQPILMIEDTTIELWLNDVIWEDCEAAETIHAFKIELETNVFPEEWTYVVYPDTPPSFDRQAVEVTRSVEPAPPSPTPIVCTPLPDDMTLDVEPKSESEAVVRLTGLQPGESLAFVFSAEISGQRRSEIESFPIDTVGEDGNFEFTQTGLTPLDETAANTWEVKVIHARGAACTEITLP